MSLLVGQTIVKVVAAHPEITGPEIAVTFSVFCGIITLLLGLVRLGILVDFIPGNFSEKNNRSHGRMMV
jgi:sodium-independent sulfate anion transporter 11